MKTKDNIHKVINLNKYIRDLKRDFEIITYTESSMIYNFVEYDKMHTLLYHDYNIHLYISGEDYCILFKGNFYKYSELKELNRQLNRILDILYYIDCVRGFR